MLATTTAMQAETKAITAIASGAKYGAMNTI
jgi:hypothetical protein